MLLAHIEFGPENAPVETTDVTWEPGESVGVADPWDENWPWLVQQTSVHRTAGNRTFTRTMTNNDSDNYHFSQPMTVVETGDFTRYDHLTFRAFTGATYLADRVESTTVTVGNESFTTSSVYANTGFLTSKTELGVTTTYSPMERATWRVSRTRTAI